MKKLFIGCRIFNSGIFGYVENESHPSLSGDPYSYNSDSGKARHMSSLEAKRFLKYAKECDFTASIQSVA